MYLTTLKQMRLSIKRGDSVERAITTAASLDAAHDSDNIIRTQTTTMPNTRSERMLEQPIEPPLLEGHTSGSGEDMMEHKFELTANVPIAPNDSPITGEVLDLEKKKDAQAVEILRLKKRVKRLERQRKSSTSQPRRRKYRHVESSDDDLNEEDTSKQGGRGAMTRQS
ncbi:hypothetical protein Tco_1519386 [Tanacetum coccineum]